MGTSGLIVTSVLVAGAVIDCAISTLLVDERLLADSRVLLRPGLGVLVDSTDELGGAATSNAPVDNLDWP